MREIAGVGATFDFDERRRPSQAVGHDARPFHRNCRVSGAVDDERGAGDFAESLGDVVTIAQASGMRG